VLLWWGVFLVLAPAASDLAHPAFSKLFVETRYLPNCGALIATRRRRDPGEQEVWAAHQLVDGGSRQPLEYETDRARFVGRCRDADAPLGVMNGARLSNTTGNVLDAMFALRHRVVVSPGATVSLSFWTMVASSRAELIDLLDKHHDANSHTRVATLAWTQAQAQLNLSQRSLSQLGAARSAAEDAADIEAWRAHLAPQPLPLVNVPRVQPHHPQRGAPPPQLRQPAGQD
jgi:hypothetical protein